MKTIFTLLLLVLPVLLCCPGDSLGGVSTMNAPPEAPGAAFYVAPTGDDANPGTQADPWQTIRKASETLTAGDTVYIRAGTFSERVTPLNSGSAGNLITYAAFPGETPVLDGTGVPLPDDLSGLFEISGRNHIRVSGLRVTNAGPQANNAGILVLNSSVITLDKNSTYNTRSSGIGIWGSDQITIDGNSIELAGGGGYQECITIAGTTNFEVKNNTVVDCQKEGIDAKDGSSNGWIYKNTVSYPKAVGIYVDAWDKYTHDIEVFQNIVHDSVESAGFAVASEMGGQLTNIRIYNNIAYHNHTYGIEISSCCSASHPMQNIHILNNTIYNNGVGWGGGIMVDNAQAQSVLVRNNLCSQNLTFQIAVAADVPAASVTVDHNLIEGFRGYEDEVYGEDHLEGDPLFANPTAADFHLLPASPGVDTGSGVDAPTIDFEGDLRPQDGNNDGTAIHDIGADEFLFGYPLLPGDMDGNMVVDLRDVIVALQAQTNQYQGPIRLASDVNGDAKVGMADAIYVLQRITGLR